MWFRSTQVIYFKSITRYVIIQFFLRFCSINHRPWCESTFQEACQSLLSDLPLSSNAPGGMPEYRCSLVISFFFKFYLAVLSRLEEATVPTELISATQPFRRGVVKSSQGFQKVPSQQLPDDTIGRPMMHLSALQQATGEARYMLRYTLYMLTVYTHFLQVYRWHPAHWWWTLCWSSDEHTTTCQYYCGL